MSESLEQFVGRKHLEAAEKEQAADPAQSAPSAEPRKVTGGLGGKFYLSPDGNWIIWDQQPSEYADAAHRGLFHALKEAKTRAETAESAMAAQREQWEGQLPKRMTINLDENCVETIKKMSAEGGEEISFGGLMGGVKLVWNPDWNRVAAQTPEEK